MIEKSKKYLIDSNIIIYHLNGEKMAMDFLENYFEESCISRLTVLEVLSFDFSDEDEKYVLKMLNSFEIIDTNEKIILQSLKNREYKKIKLVDNIIASTAQINNLILVTRNEKDFKNIKIDILNIFGK
ncbi:type II toxin-antitoxin system VapC family toxin [Aliarcobacter cryaerophilus]|uniref:Nucleotide-binding protein n=1 Tax=Aliarcobacter cryaerophilus TaxID=28198 RepID=A0A2S9TFC6_9BACT|nr:type II toxin-antitoxin system VapC family toxin [Aliarcobacter cryaerophilus]PRM97525.1 nucleotide-binding protein [Arcobacter cryaerophilus gv. crypticus]